MRILLDMDCVLADFIHGMAILHGYTKVEVMSNWPIGEYAGEVAIRETQANWLMMTGRERQTPFTSADFWRPINQCRGFWRDLPILPWAQEVFRLVTSLTDDWYIVTSPSKCRECVIEKEEWLAHHLGGEAAMRMIPTKHKHLFAVKSRGPVILVDDCDSNVVSFRDAGGIGIIFPAHHNSEHQRKDNPLEFVRAELSKL